MSLETALRATEILLALALLQQSLEHIFWARAERRTFFIRAALAIVLLTGWQSIWVLAALTAQSVVLLHRFGGAYNGGSDRLALLILFCLTAASFLPPGCGREVAFGYLALQVLLSYVVSGQVKIANAAWRRGQALADVFAFSAYPVSQQVRGLHRFSGLMRAASWAVMTLELLLPLALISRETLLLALGCALAFHLANAILFGLNRFLWIWPAGYPALLWLQGLVDPLVGWHAPTMFWGG
mgnify:CR=1 FL=1